MQFLSLTQTCFLKLMECENQLLYSYVSCGSSVSEIALTYLTGYYNSYDALIHAIRLGDKQLIDYFQLIENNLKSDRYNEWMISYNDGILLDRVRAIQNAGHFDYIPDAIIYHGSVSMIEEAKNEMTSSFLGNCLKEAIRSDKLPFVKYFINQGASAVVGLMQPNISKRIREYLNRLTSKKLIITNDIRIDESYDEQFDKILDQAEKINSIMDINLLIDNTMIDKWVIY